MDRLEFMRMNVPRISDDTENYIVNESTIVLRTAGKNAATIPNTWNGADITTVGITACNYSRIVSVEIADGITTIE